MTNTTILRETTSRPNLYDYLKIFAIVVMIVDHVGYFIYPPISEFRAIGRWAFPVFLFLVWFNHSYGWRWSLWIAALLVEIPMQLFLYHHTWSLSATNILVGIGVVRLFLGWWQSLDTKPGINFLPTLLWMWLFVVLHYLWLNELTDYGGMVFIFGLLWYLSRKIYNTQKLTLPLLLAGIAITFAVFVLHGLTQLESFGRMFASSDRTIVLLGWLWLLFWFTFLTKENTSLRIWVVMRDRLILWFSRYALWIYVVHIVWLIAYRYFFL